MHKCANSGVGEEQPDAHAQMRPDVTQPNSFLFYATVCHAATKRAACPCSHVQLASQLVRLQAMML